MVLNDYDIPDEIKYDDGDLRDVKNMLDFEAYQTEYKLKTIAMIRQETLKAVRDQNKKWNEYGDEAESVLLRSVSQRYQGAIIGIIKVDRSPYKMHSIHTVYDDILIFNKRSQYVISNYKKRIRKLGEELREYERATS